MASVFNHRTLFLIRSISPLGCCLSGFQCIWLLSAAELNVHRHIGHVGVLEHMSSPLFTLNSQKHLNIMKTLLCLLSGRRNVAWSTTVGSCTVNPLASCEVSEFYYFYTFDLIKCCNYKAKSWQRAFIFSQRIIFPTYVTQSCE